LRFLPAPGEILDASGRAVRIVLEIFDVKAFGCEKALLDRDTPGPVMGVAVALQANGPCHDVPPWSPPSMGGSS